MTVTARWPLLIVAMVDAGDDDRAAGHIDRLACLAAETGV